MYQIGPFGICGVSESAPVDLLPIRLLPLWHIQGFPWWDASTQAILRLMPSLMAPGAAVLDFGCGHSAILSIAIAVLGATPYPVEIHPELATIGQQQLAANDLTMTVTPRPTRARYDFVLANVGDASLVGEISRLAPHGVGTGRDGVLIQW